MKRKRLKHAKPKGIGAIAYALESAIEKSASSGYTKQKRRVKYSDVKLPWD